MIAYDMLIALLLIAGVIYNRIAGFKKTLSWFYVLLAPLSCIVTHSYHILVGFIHTPHHATSILIFYGIVVTVFIVTLRVAYYNLCRCIKCCSCCSFFKPPVECLLGCECCRLQEEQEHIEDRSLQKCEKKDICTPHKWPHPLVILFLCLLSVFIAGFLVYVVVLFILVPINMAIDDAPDRLLSIN